MSNINTLISQRLKALSDIVPRCECFADIGTDHAYLPVYLCMSGRVNRAIASDIVPGPLERAESTIRKFHMNDRISTRLGPGVSTLKENEADVVAVNGMGGLIIANILKDGKDVLKNTKKIILQPMTAVTELREYLLSDGWNIDKEYLVKDNGKLYNILTVTYSHKNTDASKIELFLGKRLMETKPPLYEEYIKLKIKKLRKINEGLSVSTSEDARVKQTETVALLRELVELDNRLGKESNDV